MEEEFLKLDDLREMQILESGKLIIVKPINPATIVPLFCPVCEFPMKTADDSAAFRFYECCDLCALKFAITNKEIWEKGWRPSPEELKVYRKEKELTGKPLLILK